MSLRNSFLGIALIAVIAVVSSLGLALPVTAQSATPTPAPAVSNSSVKMTASPAFSGNFKYGEWLPIWVELSNSGFDLQAEVQVQIISASTMVFTTPVELPAGARKRLPIYILPNNFSRQVVVELVSQGDLLASYRISLNPQPAITYMVGVLNPDRGALALLETIQLPGQRRPVKIVDLNISELPEQYEGLRSLDLIVINRTDTSSMTPAQSHALETWVRQGGRLVLGGGVDAANTLSGLEFSPISPSDLSIEEIDVLPGLDAYLGGERPIRVPGPFVVARVSTTGARVIASQGDLPLILEWPLDEGYINFIALDVSGSPFDAWNGAIPFWEKLLAPGAAYPTNAPPDISARQQFASGIVYPLSNLPMLDLPSIKGLALLLIIYILLVGPINYLALRRMNRLHLAWLTIPVITLVFSAASFGLGYALHGTDIFINKIAVIQLEPSGRARVDSYIGLFSPAQRAYEVKIYSSGLLSPLSPYYDPWISSPPSGLPESRRITLVQGDPAIVRGLSVEQWSMQSFMSEGALMEFGSIQADLLMESDHLKGAITNNSSFNLTDATIILGQKFQRLGDLAAGNSADVDVDLSASSQANFGAPISYKLFEKEMSGLNGPPPRQVEVKRAIVENLLERTPPYVSSKTPGGAGMLAQSPLLIAWLDQAPPRVEVAGAEPAQQTTAVVVLPLNYRLPDSGNISIPPGLIPGELIEFSREGGTCGMPGTTAVYLVRGEAIFEFTLPPEVRHIQPQTLKINLNTDAGFFTPPGLEIYHWTDSSWMEVRGVSQGLNLAAVAPGLISDDGRIRLRLSGENLQYCYFLDLGLDGSR
jgi:hypothetical protein